MMHIPHSSWYTGNMVTTSPVIKLKAKNTTPLSGELQNKIAKS
jgi:hypothetical protein